MSDDLSVRIENSVGRITLNRPNALHSLTLEMFRTLKQTVDAWATDPDVLMVMVDHADGSRGFCSGGDISMFLNAGSTDPAESRELFRIEYALNAAIDQFPKPYLGFLDGITMGGGAGITVHGSDRVATENTVFAMPETAIGLFPDIGSGYFLARMEGEVGTWLGLTGARLKASDVVTVGVANHYVRSSDIPQIKAAILTADLCGQTTAVIGNAIDRYSVAVDPPTYREQIDAINRCFRFDTAEEIVAALQRERTEWANTQLAALNTKSPTSVKIALRLIREGASCPSIAEEMQREFRIVWRRVNDRDPRRGCAICRG